MEKKQAIPRVILIVGANRGIGYYMVEYLLEHGDFISVLDIEADNLEKLKENYPDKLISITADAAKDEDIKNGVFETIKQFGKIDIAVHNACLCTFESESNSNYELYDKVMDINFFGALRLLKAVLPQMRKQGFGRVIFTCSGVGVTGIWHFLSFVSSTAYEYGFIIGTSYSERINGKSPKSRGRTCQAYRLRKICYMSFS